MTTHEYAGFWLRFVAYLIDYVIIYIAQSFIILPILAVFGLGFASTSSMMDLENMSEGEVVGMVAAFVSAMGALALVSLVISILYYTLMESSKNQATLGKMALNLKVTDQEGQPLDFGKAFLRQLGKIVSGMILMIGYIMAGFTDKKQALHDMIAGTLVVKKS